MRWWKHAYNFDKASDSFVGTINLADGDNYPNRRKLLKTTSISPTGSTEGERAASGGTMSSEWEDNLNLIQLRSLIHVDVLKVADILMRNGKRRMEQNLLPNSFSTKYNKPTESSIWKYLTKKLFFWVTVSFVNNVNLLSDFLTEKLNRFYSK